MRWMTLAVFLGLAFAAAATGALFPPGDWYLALNKPSWNPPAWLFGPVWTVLYVMIAVAGWRAWQAQPRDSSLVAFWGLQMLLNGMWSWLFFGLHRPGWALLDLGLMWLCILAFIVLAWQKDRIAAGLFIPYLAWVSFAGVLNFTLRQLNPGPVAG